MTTDSVNENSEQENTREITRQRLSHGYHTVETEDRPRGVLSESDRAYLRNFEAWTAERSRQSRTKRKKAIRQRTINAIRDFALLAVWHEDKDIEKIADALAPDAPDHSVMTAPGGGDRGTVGMIAFLTRILDGEIDTLERVISAGIADGLAFEDGETWSVDVDIDRQRTRSSSEIQQIVEDGDIDDLSEVEAKQALDRLTDD